MVLAQEQFTALESEGMSAEVCVVGPDTARRWLTENVYDGQRPLRPVTVARYEHDMAQGTFVAGTMIRFALLNGQRFLIDGQHRLSAVVRHGGEHSFIVSTQRVLSVEELAILYSTIDTPTARTAADLYRPLGLSAETGMTDSQIRRVHAALHSITAGFRPHGGGDVDLSRVEYLAMLRSYAPFALRYFTAITGRPNIIGNALERRATLGVALLTLRYSAITSKANAAPDVMEFWRGVAHDDRISASDPRKFVTRHLIETTHGASADSKTYKSAAYSARYIARGFDAYMRRAEVKGSFKVLDPAAPMQIWGVPGDPQQWIADALKRT